MRDEVVFYNKDNFFHISWEQYRHGAKIKAYFAPMMDNTSAYIRNVNTTIGFVGIDEILIPYTVNETEYDNSYVVSPYNHYITYAKEELEMLKHPFLKTILTKLINGIGIFTKRIKINQVVYLNNWLLSTNLFTNLTENQIEKLTNALIKKYPEYVIGFRSVNDRLAKEMRENLLQLGYISLPSRYVYLSDEKIFETASKKARKRLRQDERLLYQEGVEVISHDDFTYEDLIRAKQLYDFLYLEKYSYQNPQFTESYFLHTYKSKSIKYQGIRINGVLEGVLGSFIYENKMANPIAGYNTKMPKEIGLYRMIRALGVKTSIENKLIYHQSAGVGRFKYNRGAQGFPEYTMILVKHLSINKRWFWKSLAFLFEKVGIPIVEKKRL